MGPAQLSTVAAAPLHDFATLAAPSALSDYPSALVEVTLDRVIASKTFQRSERHRQFLVHVVRAGLDGRHDQLKEVIIGVEVFGRALPQYDPRRDPIVRVEAGRIRDKLARFYDNEGAAESFQIAIPVGSYSPRFGRRKFVPRCTPTLALAVLPFTNLSGESDDAAFSSGLADQLIDALGRVPGLKLIARLSTLKARDLGLDIREIGKLLVVDHVVEGSLQRHGGQRCCFAHLTRTRDGVRIWSKRFDHDGDRDEDLFTFQDQIAEAVMRAITLLHTPAAHGERVARSLSGLQPAHTGSREARDLFERARSLCQQHTVESLDQGIVLLERAVALDPRFASAYSHLASALAELTSMIVAPTFPLFDRVKRTVHLALQLDRLDGDAHALLAVIAHRIDHDWARAEPLFHDALRLAPNAPAIHSSYAWGLVYNGRFDEAMQYSRLAQDLDPLNRALRAHGAAIAHFAREDDFAVRELESLLALAPVPLFPRVMFAVVLIVAGDLERAMALLDRICHDTPSHATAHFCRVCIHGLRNDVETGRAELAALLVQWGDRYFSRVNLAMAQACLGELDDAFASLDLAAQARDLLFVSVPVHRLFDRLRHDPRYRSLAERYHLPLLQLPTTNGAS